jgi:hypothetical protein
MPTSRVNQIVTRVLWKLKDLAERNITRDIVLDSMNLTQRELCRDYLAIKIDQSLTLIPLQESYDLDGDLFKIAQIITPSTWLYPLEITTDANLWNNWSEDNVLIGTNPVKGLIWNKILRLLPVPNTLNDTLSILGYAMPGTPMEFEGNPEVGEEFDECLEWGALYRITGDEKYRLMCEAKATRNAGQNKNESIQGIIRIDHSSNRIGF